MFWATATIILDYMLTVQSVIVRRKIQCCRWPTLRNYIYLWSLGQNTAWNLDNKTEENVGMTT